MSRSPPPRAAARPAPRAAPPPPPPQSRPSGGLMGGGLGSAVATGMAFGAGSEIAHQAVRGIMGSGSGGHGEPAPAAGAPAPPASYQEAGAPAAAAPAAPENPCMSYNQSLFSCLKQNSNEIGMCQNYMSMLKQCEMDNAHFFQQPPQF